MEPCLSYKLTKIASKHVIGVVGGGALDFDECQEAIEQEIQSLLQDNSTLHSQLRDTKEILIKIKESTSCGGNDYYACLGHCQDLAKTALEQLEKK